MGKKRVGLNLVGFEIDENESAHLEFHNGIKMSFELQDLENGEEGQPCRYSVIRFQ